MVVIGLVSESPGFSFCSLHIEGSLVHVTDGTPASNQITQGESKLPPPGIQLRPVQLSVPVPQLRRQKAHLVLLIESLQLSSTDAASPHFFYDRGPLSNRIRLPVLQQR